jgi:hypothetical protein
MRRRGGSPQRNTTRSSSKLNWRAFSGAGGSARARPGSSSRRWTSHRGRSTSGRPLTTLDSFRTTNSGWSTRRWRHLRLPRSSSPPSQTLEHPSLTAAFSRTIPRARRRRGDRCPRMAARRGRDLSLGCGAEALDVRTRGWWRSGFFGFAPKVVDVFLTAQSDASCGTAIHLLGDRRHFHRISPTLPARRYGLDVTRELPSLSASEILRRATGSRRLGRSSSPWRRSRSCPNSRCESRHGSCAAFHTRVIAGRTVAPAGLTPSLARGDHRFASSGNDDCS